MRDKPHNFRSAFLKATFSFLGYIAHCDGPVNRDEVNRLKLHMKKMRLSEEEQRNALQLFKFGTAFDFPASDILREFSANTTAKLLQILLVHLLTMARADGYLMEKEFHALQWIARELGYKSIAFHHLLKIIYEQDQLAHSRNPIKTVNDQPNVSQRDAGKSQHHNPRATSYDHDLRNQNLHNRDLHNQDLQKAYKILGVTAEMTEDEIRRTYKRLASQLHPDKLISQELSPEQRNVATEDFKRLQAAYAFIKKYRSIYAAN